MNIMTSESSDEVRKIVSRTSWIGHIGGEFNDLQVDVEDNSRVGSGELRLATDLQSSDSSSNNDGEELKQATNGIAHMKLRDKSNGSSGGPLHPTSADTAVEMSSSTHRSPARNSGSRRRRKEQRISIFTSHTAPSMVSSYHSSELDNSFSEDELSDSELASSDDDESLEASIGEESKDGEDDIKSILSSDFDSCDLDLDDSNNSKHNKSVDSSLKEQQATTPTTTPPPTDKRSKLDWMNDKRWATLENSPPINPDPFVQPQDSHNSSSRMVSNSSIFVQVSRSSNIDQQKMEVILQGDDEISLNDGNPEYAVEYNDTDDCKKKKKKTVADVLERDPDSNHSSFMLEVGIQRNVSGLTIQSALLRSNNNSTRARRRGSKRTRKVGGQNEAWDHGPTSPTQHAMLGNKLPNQPLPPPPPRTETPSQHWSPKSFTGKEIFAGRKRSSKTKWSHHSRVSALSYDEEEEDGEEFGQEQVQESSHSHGNNRSRADSFESSWASTIGPSPAVSEKKKVKIGDASVQSLLTSPDNPTFRAVTQEDLPLPPPPHRSATPRNSLQNRPPLVDMRSASALTFDSKEVSTTSVKQRNRETLERLNDQMIATIGVSSPGLIRAKSSKSNLSIGQRRESMKKLREKLRNSFKHVISPNTKIRKTLSSPIGGGRKKLSPTTGRKTMPHRSP